MDHNNGQDQYQPREEAPPYGMQPVVGEEMPPAKHSGIGIASFILAIVSILAVIIGFATMAGSVSEYITPDGELIDPDLVMQDQSLIMGAFLLFASLGTSFVGLILSIVGLNLRNRRKTFAIIGLVLNGLYLLAVVALFVIGILAAATFTT